MLIRFGDTYLNTTEIVTAQITRKDEISSAVISLKNGTTVEATDGVDYLQTVLDACHVLSIQRIRDRLPSN
jgi:hypothetical protein